MGDELLAGFAASPPPAQRPENATLPPNGVESLVGVYDNPAYGQLELCLASSHSSTVPVTDGCQALLSNVTVTLPGVVDTAIPTLLAKWDRPFGSYLRLTHFNGSVFPIAMFDIYVSILVYASSLADELIARSPPEILLIHFGYLLYQR